MMSGEVSLQPKIKMDREKLLIPFVKYDENVARRQKAAVKTDFP